MSQSNPVGTSSNSVYTVEHDFEGDRSLSTTVITAIADVADEQPLDLPPLYDTIDPDTLDSLFSPNEGGGDVPDHIGFTHAGCTVAVHSDGKVIVEEAPR